MPPVFVDASELAQAMGVTVATVQSWARQGKIPHLRDSKRRLLFDVDAVRDALRARQTAGGSFRGPGNGAA